MLLGVDVGGTFTDAVLFDGEELHTAKTSTTPGDESLGVIEAIDAVLRSAGTAATAVTTFAHGMTVGTNALLEERGARTALVATEGFTDLLDVARQDRPHLYRLCAPKPRPLVGDALRIAAAERAGPDGIVRPLSEEEVERIAGAVVSCGAESVAICLLFSYRSPQHERRIAAAIRARDDAPHVSVSHEVLAQFREYERCSTTVIDAYLSPLLGRYLHRLGEAAAERGLPAPSVMRSSGGVVDATEAARSGAWSVLSGPAGGAIGAALIAGFGDHENVLGFDMGGTSCDVCVIENGRVRRTDTREIGGRMIQLPMIDVHTVGAGGGSIAWADAGGALRVGPRSAGAQPGPAAYGRGGSEPTVTDANLCLGVIAAGAPLAGGVELDGAAAEQAIAGLAGRLGIEPIAAAEGIIRVANQEMVRALRVVTVERGIDPRGFALMPFGGAGPMHAAAIAGELGIGRVLCPRAGGVLSALGLLASERRRDAARTVMLATGDLDRERLAAIVAELSESIAEGMAGARRECACELRYRGQSFELTIAAGDRPDLQSLREAFEAEHERRYGYRDPDAEVELVTVRVALAVPGPKPRPQPGTGALERSRRSLRAGGQWVDAAVIRGEPAAGDSFEGPCVVELAESTLVLPEGWSAAVDEGGTIDARRGR